LEDGFPTVIATGGENILYIPAKTAWSSGVERTTSWPNAAMMHPSPGLPDANYDIGLHRIVCLFS
jgi:hypothetical protein